MGELLANSDTRKREKKVEAPTYVKNSVCSCWDLSGRCLKKQLMSIKSFLVKKMTN